MAAKQKSGGRRLRESGKRAIQLGVLPEDYDLLAAAAKAQRLPLTGFLLRAGLTAAKKELRKDSE